MGIPYIIGTGELYEKLKMAKTTIHTFLPTRMATIKTATTLQE